MASCKTDFLCLSLHPVWWKKSFKILCLISSMVKKTIRNWNEEATCMVELACDQAIEFFFLLTSTSTSTLFHKTIGYNRLAHKIAIANLGGPVKRKIKWKKKKGNILSYNNLYFYHSFILITTTSKEKWKRNWWRVKSIYLCTEIAFRDIAI